MILRFLFIFVCVSSQYIGNTVTAYLTSTTNVNPPQLNLTFSQPLNSTPAFQIFTASAIVSYQIVSNTNNQTIVIKAISPSDILADTVTLMFNQPLDLNLTISSFILKLDVLNGVQSTLIAPVIISTIAFLLCLYGNAGIMMVQYFQIYTEVRSLNIFYYGFITHIKDITYFRWKNIIFSSLNQKSFLNSCFFIAIIYVVTITITGIIWKLIRDPTNPVLKWIKKMFNFSFLIVIYKITMIPLGFGIIQNFILASTRPPVTPLLITNQVICIIFGLIYLGSFGLIIWFMHYSKIQDYYEPKTHTAYRKLYMEIQTNKGYKRFYVVYLYLKALAMAISITIIYGVMYVVVLQDFQIFMIMITRPYKNMRYYQMMLFAVTSQFLSYLFECTGFMFRHLGITLMQNHGNFVIGTTSLIFFAVTWFILISISGYELYVKIRAFIDNFKWERRESDRMIEMNKITSKRQSFTKRESLLNSPDTGRSRHMTRISQLS